MLGCRDCTNLETLVLALARRLHDLEQRLQALDRRLRTLEQVERRLNEVERRLRRSGSGAVKNGALTFTVPHGQNGPPGAGAGPGPGGE